MKIENGFLKRGLLALGGVIIMVAAASSSSHSFIPKDGFVPNESTAIKIAEAIWEPIYGKENISMQHPIIATLTKGTWTVVGTKPESSKGGVALVEISKRDGRILRVSHGK